MITSEALVDGSTAQKIASQLQSLLNELDRLPGYEMTAIHIDEAIHSLPEHTKS